MSGSLGVLRQHRRQAELQLQLRRLSRRVDRMSARQRNLVAMRFLERCNFLVEPGEAGCESCGKTPSDGVLFWMAGPYEYERDGSYHCARCCILKHLGNEAAWKPWWAFSGGRAGHRLRAPLSLKRRRNLA